jgi:ubiquinone/menaquinone biosynthesis C-methylase UbiE
MEAERTLHLQWLERAAASLENGEMDRWISTELNNLAWFATIDALSRWGKVATAHRVLEVGFGWGRVVIGLKQLHPHIELHGIELAPEFVTTATDLVGKLGLQDVHLSQGDVYTMAPPEEPFDLVYATRVLHYLDDKVTALRNMREAVRPGGRLVVLIPNGWNPAQRATYNHELYSPLALKRDVEAAGFTNARLRTVRFLPGRVASRFPHTSSLRWLERGLRTAPPTRWMGALAVITATRPV